ncbi:hypothetical protein EJB05_21737, partial [Eragrostis curvula]
MRAGGYTVHQSLTAEAAAVLKLALALARSRGHAQVTPLHVAFTLLSSSSAAPPPPSSSSPLFGFAAAGSSASAYGLLRRACAQALPGSAGAARCRALELCFNVALNRLPAPSHAVASPLSSSSTSSSSSSSAGSGATSTPFAASLLVQPNPTLSNALVAALKRAQANQRRGCVELQNQQAPPTPTTAQQQQQQQQQPLLTIKVELDQLIVSILDDPSVSRVMREAGFSSAAVKTSLEEESAMLLGLGNHHGSSTPSSSPAPAAPIPPQFFFETCSGGFPTHAGDSGGGGALWPPAQFLNHRDAKLESTPSKAEDDVRAILEVMSSRRQQGRRTNPAVVGDSTSAAEASVAELMRRLEIGGDVPDELRGAHVLRLHLSHVHVRLMARADADAWAADLRRTVAACTNKSAALVIYVGDMRWAVVDDDDRRAAPRYSAAEHMAAALARLLGELRAAGRACWLVAAASYRTYMLCQRRALDATWALQPVSVPSGAGAAGLGLALGTRAASPRDNKIARFPLLDLEPEREDGAASLCAECARNFEREASAVRAKAEGTNLALSYFPGWPQADKPQTSHKYNLMELKRKWSRLCQRDHHLQYNHPARLSNAKSSDGVCLSLETPSCHGASMVNHRDVKTTLSLLLPDSTEAANDGVYQHRSEHPDLVAKSCDKKSVPLWSDELPSGDLKRKAESCRPACESKRRRSSGVLDLNLCADEEEDGSEDEPVPSDLTNDGEGSSGDVTDSLDNNS